MEYTINYRTRPNYLLVHVRSPFISPEISETYVERIRDECAGTGHTRVIIMRDIPATLDRVSFYKMTDQWRRPLDGLRVAWVNPYPQNFPVLEFAMELGRHRGSDFRLFDKFDPAVEWMLNGSFKGHVRRDSPALSLSMTS